MDEQSRLQELILYCENYNWRIVSRGPHSFVIESGKQVNLRLHLIIILLTGGLWALPFAIIRKINYHKNIARFEIRA